MNPAPAASPLNCLALDIGGTKAEAAVVSPSGRILRRDRTEVRAAGDDLFGAIVRLLDVVRAGEAVSSLGVACAGPMQGRGDWVSPLNIPVWRQFPLRERLAEATHLRVDVDGDVRALALAEGRFGAGQGLRNFASLVVSTGIGGALVLDGRLIDGDTGNSGHIGHLNVVPEGRACSCGARGCLEAEVSGWAITEITGQSPEHADEALRRRTAQLVGRAVGTLASVLDFRHCFVAGSVALGFGDHFFTTATASAREMATMHFTRGLEIRPSGLGPDGPILGASCVARRDEP